MYCEARCVCVEGYKRCVSIVIQGVFARCVCGVILGIILIQYVFLCSDTKCVCVK